MKSNRQIQLKEYNSFNVESLSPLVFYPCSYDDLIELSNNLSNPFYILGEGYNTLFVDDIAPTIIKPHFKGISIHESEDAYILEVAANENWHELVCHCVKSGIYGLENLALIPGSVGAAPIQNIGAYGVELSDYCSKVKWFEFSTKKLHELSNQECHFAYRESIFKNELKQKGLIIGVTLVLPKRWQANLSYSGLNELPKNAPATEVMMQVIKLRQSKLPDPVQLPNAGSFFKNPTIDKEEWQKLTEQYPDMPSYPQTNGKVKVAAGWLIEHAGLKGYQKNGVGIHDKQALVLVNHQNVSGQHIVKLAQYVQQKVSACFGLWLEPEVRFVYTDGEQTLTSVNSAI